MRRTSPAAFVGIGVAGLVLVAAVTLWHGQPPSGRQYLLTVDHGAYLTEPLALDVTLAALLRDGRQRDQLSPVRYRFVESAETPEQFLLRDPEDPTRGSVNWVLHDGMGMDSFTVKITVRAGRALCEVFGPE